MQVKLVQIDGKLPNLALMQLASWHKSRGDAVTYTRDTHHDLLDPHFDRVYASAIFKFSADKIARLRSTYPDAIIGGTGSDSNQTVEQVIGSDWPGLDYSLYPAYTPSLGFTQRGCRLSCKFCVVPGKEGKARSVAATKVAKAPPVAPKRPGQGAAAKSNAEAMKRLSRTGSIKDALQVDWD